MHKEIMNFSDDIHRFIILEMFLKTLDRDKLHVAQLKMGKILDEWYDQKSNETFQDLKKLRDYLYKQGCKIEKQRSDEFVTEYFVLFRGVTETRTYTNIAIRNWVSHEMRRVLGMEYLTPQDRK